jgi:hypothetical protein
MPHAVEENEGNGPGDWMTPRPLGRRIVLRYGLDYDAFASRENTLAAEFSAIDGTFRIPGMIDPRFTEPAFKLSNEDGFARPWAGRGTFLNPPYTRGFMPLAIEKCIAEAQGIDREPARIVVGLFMCDTSTIYWRERVIPNAESIQYLPRVKYELSPSGLVAWREAGKTRELAKMRNVTNEQIARLRTKWEKRLPDSPNFGSAIVVFRGPDWL